MSFALPLKPGPVLWFCADNGVTKDAKNFVLLWKDLSTESNNAAQPTQAQRPILRTKVWGSRRALSTDGFNQQMYLSSAMDTLEDFTAFFAMKPDFSWGAELGVISTYNGARIEFRTDTKSVWLTNDDVLAGAANVDSPLTDAAIYCIKNSGSSFNVYKNGVQIGSGTRGGEFTFDTILEDNFGQFAGLIGAMVIYDRLLSVEDMQKVNDSMVKYYSF